MQLFYSLRSGARRSFFWKVLARQGCHCNATASRYPLRSEMPDAKKPFRRNAERLFQKLLNRYAGEFEYLSVDGADLTG
ncbi:hypothetical protein [Caballeronia sordidicola]|jgi:hypothetical protein|nr:hypothetical protein [Caballeronia sordidicola]